MEIRQRAGALLAYIGYYLSRYRFFFVPLDELLLALLLFSPVYIAWHGWREGFRGEQFLAIALCLLAFLALFLVRAKKYLFFAPEASDLGNEPPPRVEEKISIRGTGYFEVEGKRRHFIEIPALFWTTELGDHILMGRVKVVSIPLLISPVQERGMWYIFISPKDVLSVTTGRLYFGLSRRQAVQLGYREPTGAEATAYLSFDTPNNRNRLIRALTARSGVSCSRCPKGT